MSTLNQLADTTQRRQEGVKKGPFVAVAIVDPVSLKSLRLELGKSLAGFGVLLARAMGKKKALSKQYIDRLEKGKDTITPEISAAFWRMAAAADGTDPETATLQESTVLSRYNLAGVFVAGLPVECARPGCKVRFVKLNNFQKYHSPHCRAQAERERALR